MSDTLLNDIAPLGSLSSGPKPLPELSAKPFASRIAYAAAHVVSEPLTCDPSNPVLAWDHTLAFRRYLWSLGFGVAEAMDTAQRGMGLPWPLALELIQRSAREARACNGRIASGAGTDHLSPTTTYTLDQITAAYLMQCEAVEAAGSRIILMASRALAAAAHGIDDYRKVYDKVLSQLKQPAILHWLGPMFDPALAGYWGSPDIPTALNNCLALIRENAANIDGIKISLLNADLEIAMRRQLPKGVRMYTGDDYNYDRLILGDEHGHSDALLGIFDPIAHTAAAALQALDANDIARYNELLGPTVALSRRLFEPPTYNYKTGIVFLAWLNGHQPHFRMIGGAESARSVSHLFHLAGLAEHVGIFLNYDKAIERYILFARVNLGRLRP